MILDLKNTSYSVFWVQFLQKMGSVNFMFIKSWLQAKIQNLETDLQTDKKIGRLTERRTAELKVLFFWSSMLTQHQSQLRWTSNYFVEVTSFWGLPHNKAVDRSLSRADSYLRRIKCIAFQRLKTTCKKTECTLIMLTL